MRRALRKEMPALTAVYGILPADLDQMTVAEIGEYFVQMSRFRPSTWPQSRR